MRHKRRALLGSQEGGDTLDMKHLLTLLDPAPADGQIKTGAGFRFALCRGTVPAPAHQ